MVTSADLIALARREIEKARAAISGKLSPHGLAIPSNVETQLDKCRFLTGQELADGIKKAHAKAEMHYLSMWVKGKIKSETDSTDEERAKQKEKFAALKQMAREKKEIERKEREERKARIDTIDQSVKLIESVPAPKPIVPKSKMWENQAAQAERLKKYPHAIAGTFREDPARPGHTLVDIRCHVPDCKQIRTIPVGELFHIKVCVNHRGGQK